MRHDTMRRARKIGATGAEGEQLPALVTEPDMAPRPRVLIAADHVTVAQGLSRLLKGAVEMVAAASDAGRSCELARLHQPDIIRDLSGG
jgi:PleD family two-component response regulator